MTSHWFILKADGNVYGPATLTELKEWVSDGRIEPDDQLSPDEETWTPAIEYAELEMEYIILFPENQLYGPVHRAVLDQLIKDGDIAADQLVRHASSGRELTAREAADGQLQANEAQTTERSLSARSTPAESVAQPQGSSEGDFAIAIAEARAETAAEYYKRLQSLESDKKTLVAAVDAMTREVEKAKQAAQAARLEIIHAKKAEIATLRDRIKELEGEQESAGRESTQQMDAAIQALESRTEQLTGERDEARTQVIEQAHELQRIEARATGLEKQLTEALTELDNQQSAESEELATQRAALKELEERLAGLTRDRDEARTEKNELANELRRVKEREVALERQLKDALTQADQRSEAEQADSAASEELAEVRSELERVQDEKNAEVIALRKQLTQLKAQVETFEQQSNSKEPETTEIDEQVQAIQRAWDEDKAEWTKREQQMRQRLAQFEGELKEKMAAFVEAKQVATSRPQEGAQTSAAGQVPSVPRAALSRLQEQAATGMAAIHRPAAQTQRAAALTRVRVPPKKNKGKRPPFAGRR